LVLSLGTFYPNNSLDLDPVWIYWWESFWPLALFKAIFGKAKLLREDLKARQAALYLGGGFKYLLFSSLFGEYSDFESYFSDGLVQPQTRYTVRRMLSKHWHP